MITVKLRNIGNSKGIIIPKELLVLCNMDEEVSIEIKGQQLIVSKVSSKSIDWEKAFDGCNAENPAERQIAQTFTDFPNTFDQEEWTW
jgi:antitoxin component of MazEF toxin-antitoxin module